MEIVVQRPEAFLFFFDRAGGKFGDLRRQISENSLFPGRGLECAVDAAQVAQRGGCLFGGEILHRCSCLCSAFRQPVRGCEGLYDYRHIMGSGVSGRCR